MTLKVYVLFLCSINNINGKACKGLIGPACKRLSYSSPEEFCRLKYEPNSTSTGINYLAFLLLEGESVTLKAIFLFDPLYCNFMYSLQRTLPHRVFSLPLALHTTFSHQPVSKMNLLLGEIAVPSSCVFKICSGTLYENREEN